MTTSKNGLLGLVRDGWQLHLANRGLLSGTLSYRHLSKLEAQAVLIGTVSGLPWHSLIKALRERASASRAQILYNLYYLYYL